jgi:hypothetical protein
MTSRVRVRSRSRIRKKVAIALLVGSLITISSLAAIIVPLYSYPGVDWNAIIAAKQANPGVSMVVIINPDNGPGLSQDPNYVTGVNNLRAAGVIVLGYDHTSYAARPLSVVIADVNSYKAWYNLSGIFFDEMSNVPGNENYYSTLNQYAKSVGLPFTVGNPGGTVPASFQGTMDVIVTYENQGVPGTASLASITGGLPKNTFAVIAYGVDSFNASAVSNIFDYANYVYVTNDTLPNPYGAVTGDFSKLVSLVAGLGKPQMTSTLNVLSVDSAGTPIVGLQTTIASTTGSTLDAGYTPLTYSAPSGSELLVSVANYGSFVFSHWSDGGTNPLRALEVTTSTTLTAYYSSPANSTRTPTATSTSAGTSQSASTDSTSNGVTSAASGSAQSASTTAVTKVTTSAASSGLASTPSISSSSSPSTSSSTSSIPTAPGASTTTQASSTSSKAPAVSSSKAALPYIALGGGAVILLGLFAYRRRKGTALTARYIR